MPTTVQEIISRLDEFLAQERFADARAFLYESLHKYLSEGNVLAAVSIYNEIMGFERQYGDPVAAVEAADAALTLLDEQELANSRPAAMIVLNAATVYKNAGLDEGAAMLYDRAEALFGRYYPAGAKEFAGLFNNRASVYLTPENYPKAEYYYTRALGILQRHGDVCDTAVTCFNLAWLYARWPGREAQSHAHAALGARVLEIPEKNRDAYYYYTCRKCAAAARELGETAIADRLNERAEAYYAGN
jgi:tetratricopeptide (TPR) repeat protein